MTPRTNALADRFGDIDPDSPYWEALNLATELEKELGLLGPNDAQDAEEKLCARCRGRIVEVVPTK